MSGFASRSANRASNRGIALIITLATVVLLTFLIVAFFSAVTASRKLGNTRTGGVSADLLAQGALAAIENDLQAEIRNGSTAITVGANTVYTPKANSDMLPQRAVEPSIPISSAAAGYPDFLNLVKQSGQPLFSGAPIFNFSATDSTSDVARNERLVNPVRWSAPMLTGSGFSAAQAPKWIYVNRDGYAATASDRTIGRIAFNVYDIGGLLDANVAGFAPKSGGVDLPDEVGTKGPSVWADLRVLPGVNETAFASKNTWPPQWRITGNWATFTADGPSSSLPYYQRTGWLQAFQTTAGTSSDRMFASRQDLIRYAKANTPDTFEIDSNGSAILPALQYLTTFSRTLERPSFEPDTNRPKVINATENDAHGQDDRINPSLLSATKSDGSPAVARRFPLSRLSLVATPVPPDLPTGASDVLRYFGLTWDTSNNRWSYDHGSSNNILRLTDVPADREPDFFELLKGALSVGSLGKQYGIINPISYRGLGLPSELARQDASINYQIIQIAANIIDQSDGDSYPTRIYFDGREFYGNEDLPGLYRARYYTFDAGQIPSTDKILVPMLISPELWNPHRPPTAVGGAVPVNFRIVGDTSLGAGLRAATFIGGGVHVANYTANDPLLPNCDSPISYIPGQGASSDDANASITFTVGTGAASFREPTQLDTVGVPGAANPKGLPENVRDMAPGDPTSPRLPSDPNAGLADTVFSSSRLGFVVGYALRGLAPGGGTAPYKNVQSWGGPLALELQYQDPADSSQWWTIDRMNQCSIASGPIWIPNLQFRLLERTDPRTDRWGSAYRTVAYTTPTDGAIIPTGRTSNPSPGTWLVPIDRDAAAPGWVWGGARGERAHVQRNASVDPLFYQDPDGVQRRGDSAYASNTSSIGWPQNTGNDDSRPIMLNRPFRSVAELGHVFRGAPWKSLDLMTPESGDLALLDIFCLTETPEDLIVAGRVNLNTRQAPVIQALIQGVGLVNTGRTIDPLLVQSMATELTAFTSGTGSGEGPLRNRSDLVGRWVTGTNFVGVAERMADKLDADDRPIPFNRDAIISALADAGTTTAWSFLIDVIAQSGTVAPTGEFIPQGESRIWRSVAIDRPTATIIDYTTEIPAE